MPAKPRRSVSWHNSMVRRRRPGTAIRHSAGIVACMDSSREAARDGLLYGHALATERLWPVRQPRVGPAFDAILVGQRHLSPARSRPPLDLDRGRLANQLAIWSFAGLAPPRRGEPLQIGLGLTNHSARVETWPDVGSWPHRRAVLVEFGF